MGQSKSPRRCRNCGHDIDHHSGPACQRCRPGRRCAYFRAPVAVLICLRSTTNPEWTEWRSAAEARVAEAELCHPCGPKCRGAHVLVAYDADGQPHIVPTDAPPPPLDEELRQLYPSLRKKQPWHNKNRPLPPPDPLPVSWPAPEEFNEPLEASPTPNVIGPRIRRGQTIDLLRQLARVAK